MSDEEEDDVFVDELPKRGVPKRKPVIYDEDAIVADAMRGCLRDPIHVALWQTLPWVAHDPEGGSVLDYASYYYGVKNTKMMLYVVRKYVFGPVQESGQASAAGKRRRAARLAEVSSAGSNEDIGSDAATASFVATIQD